MAEECEATAFPHEHGAFHRQHEHRAIHKQHEHGAFHRQHEHGAIHRQNAFKMSKTVNQQTVHVCNIARFNVALDGEGSYVRGEPCGPTRP